MFLGLISVGIDVVTKIIRKTVLPEAKAVLFYVILIVIMFAVQCSGESCYQFKGIENVTIDTDQCIWEYFTGSKSKRFCLNSCIKNTTVRPVIFILTKTEELLSEFMHQEHYGKTCYLYLNQKRRNSIWNRLR